MASKGRPRGRRNRVSTRRPPIAPEVSTVSRPPGAEEVYKIVVSGYPTTLFEVNEFADPEQIGMFDDDTHELFILKRNSSRMARMGAIVHEVLHAIDRIVLNPEDRLSERQINMVSTALVDTLARNEEFRNDLYEVLNAT